MEVQLCGGLGVVPERWLVIELEVVVAKRVLCDRSQSRIHTKFRNRGTVNFNMWVAQATAILIKLCVSAQPDRQTE